MNSKRNLSAKALGFAMIAGLSLPMAAAAAEKLPFDQIWSRIRSQSAGIQASGKDIEAAKLAADRAGNHWYPRVMLDTKAYVTNDAGLTFFSLLGERRADVTDFAPPQLNHPGSDLFEKASLIVDFPVYEGGQKEAMAETAKLAVGARESARQAGIHMELAQAAREYALILSADSERTALTALDNRVDQLIRRYQLGSKNNPVGYAGALGLKSLQARLHGLVERNAATRKSLIAAISVRSELDPSAWEPVTVSYQEHLSGSFGPLPEAGDNSASPYAKAMYDGAGVAARASEAEKARFLPRAGLFAQGDLTNGDRATDAAYTMGAYLQWSVFDASSHGTEEQAVLQAEAMRLRADQQVQNERIARAQTREALAAIERNLKLLDESLELSDEQIQTSEMLFRNGSINALQLAEVLSRRADLVLARSETERNWIDMRVQGFVSSAGTTGSNP